MSEAVETRSDPPQDPAPDPTPDSTPAPGKAGALYELTKPGIAGYVMMTAGVSYYVASGGSAEILPVTHTILGVALGTAGALVLALITLGVSLAAAAKMTRSRARRVFLWSLLYQPLLLGLLLIDTVR